jgi:hypothetical protein
MLSPFIDEMLPAHSDSILSGTFSLGDVPADLQEILTRKNWSSGVA